MKQLNRFIIVLVIATTTHYVKGQGCSDAGFCTINTLKPKSPEATEINKNNQIKFGLSNGKADNNINIWGSYLEYNRLINDKFSCDIKLTYLVQNGPLAKSAGLSDLFLNVNYSGSKNTFFTAGVKFPLNDGNKKKNGLSLPMDYQTSLGTTDLVLGLGRKIKKLQLALALQQPLLQNKNSFLSTDHPDGSAFSLFQSTNKYTRKGDVLLRASYLISISEKLKLMPGILPIYHLSDDEYINAAGMKNKIVDSKGLTLNGNLFIEYSLNKFNVIELSVGAPFIARKVRPDGLTRKYVFTIEYKCSF